MKLVRELSAAMTRTIPGYKPFFFFFSHAATSQPLAKQTEILGTHLGITTRAIKNTICNFSVIMWKKKVELADLNSCVHAQLRPGKVAKSAVCDSVVQSPCINWLGPCMNKAKYYPSDEFTVNECVSECRCWWRCMAFSGVRFFAACLYFTSLRTHFQRFHDTDRECDPCMK